MADLIRRYSLCFLGCTTGKSDESQRYSLLAIKQLKHEEKKGGEIKKK
jgi:hypothetical protein